MAIYLIKAVALMFALTLLAFASLQLNDPDPIIWAGLYIICALIPLLLVFNIFHPPLFWVAVVLCGIRLVLAATGAFEYFQHMSQEPLMQGMNPNKPYIEEAREFLGLLIALAMLGCSALLARSRYLKR